MSNEKRLAEAFACAPALRLEAHERVSTLQIAAINERFDRVELLIERLERRLWLTLYGVAGVILAQAFQGIMDAVPIVP